MLSHLESDHLFTFNFATMFYQYPSQKHYQTPVYKVAYGRSFVLHISKSCSPQIRICLISFKVIQILSSAVSGKMLQIAFSFQNSVSVTYIRHFFLFQVCTTNVHINHGFILSKSLNSPNLYINWANMWYPDNQNKKLNLCLLNKFQGFSFMHQMSH